MPGKSASAGGELLGAAEPGELGGGKRRPCVEHVVGAGHRETQRRARVLEVEAQRAAPGSQRVERRIGGQDELGRGLGEPRETRPRARRASPSARGDRARRWSRRRSRAADRGSWRRTRQPRRPPTRPRPSRRSPARRRGRCPGSSPPRKKAFAPSRATIQASMPAVVVLPCAPATAISRRSAQSSASSSPRCRTRWPRSRARPPARGCLGDRRRDDDLRVLGHLLGIVADPRLDARRAQALEIGALGPVAAGHRARRAGDRPAPGRSSPRRRSR